MDKMINDMFNRRISETLYGSVAPPSVGTHPGTAREMIDDMLRNVLKAKRNPAPGTSYCSWAFFVSLLMASDISITDGHRLSATSWRFELDGTLDFIVSEAIPVDDKAFQFKSDFSYSRPYDPRITLDGKE